MLGTIRKAFAAASEDSAVGFVIGITLAVIVAGVLEGSAVFILSPVMTIGSNLPLSGRWQSLLSRLPADTAVQMKILLAAFFLMGIVSGLFRFLASELEIKLHGRVEHAMRIKLVDALITMRWPSYVHLRTGDLVKAMLVEGHNASRGIGQVALAMGALGVAVYFVLLSLAISIPIAIGAILGAAVVMQLLRWIGGRTHIFADRYSQEISRVGEVSEETLASMKFLRSSGLAGAASAEIAQLSKISCDTLHRADRCQTVSRLTVDVFGAVTVAAILAASFFAKLLPVTSVMIFLVIFYRLVPRVQSVQDGMNQARIQLGFYDSWRKRFEGIQEEREQRGGNLLPHFDGDLEIDAISLAYPGGGHRALDGVSFTLRPKTSVALIGRSGAGKSSLLDLVTGILQPSSGELRLAGQNLENLDLNAYHSQIGVVIQDAPIFHTTVLANIAPFDPYPDRARARTSAELAEAWSFIEALPDGLDTIIGSRGGRLSGGQRQRLALARALYLNPALLILDEATSNLDGMAEDAILATLAGLKGRITMLIVTHRLALARLADMILVIENGQVVEQGSWDELSASARPTFRELARLGEQEVTAMV
jgi:ATP-binding cassette, subfamily C, bacterial